MVLFIPCVSDFRPVITQTSLFKRSSFVQPFHFHPEDTNHCLRCMNLLLMRPVIEKTLKFSTVRNTGYFLGMQIMRFLHYIIRRCNNIIIYGKVKK